MSGNREGWSARKKVKHSLLKRAFEQNRGHEVILLIQWRLAQESHKNEGYVKLAKKFLIDEGNATQPRAIRALNLIAKEKGVNVIYRDAETGAPPKQKIDVVRFLKDMPEEDRIMLPESAVRNQKVLIPILPFGIHKEGQPYLVMSAPADPANRGAERFGIRPLTEEERSLRKMFKAFGEQRDVRMEDVPEKVISRPDDLQLLAAAERPKGYTPH